MGAYRYGFNGKELDKETSSTSTYDYGFRIYSPALGRFLSVDPLTKSYPELTPFQFSSNRPIDGIDLDGLEYVSVHHYAKGGVAKTEFYKMTDKDIKRLGGTTAGIHNSVAYGPEGRGIAHYYYDEKGNRGKPLWEQRQTGGTSDFEFNGLYSGPGSVTYDGKPKSRDYNFTMQPIDWADAIAKRHDMDYAKATATGEKDAGYLEDVRTVQADRDMVNRIDELVANSTPFGKQNGTEGVETPVRTSYSTEMDFTLIGQKVLIGSLATYKQWKIDNTLGNDNKYKDNRKAFGKAHPATALILDQTPAAKEQ